MPSEDEDWVDPDQPRLVVDVTARTAIALDALVADSGNNKTTVIASAVKFYAEMRALQKAGGRIMIQQPGTKGWEELMWVPRESGG